MSDAYPFDPERVIRAFAEQNVEYLIVGALAARLQGFPRLTADIDVTPAPGKANLERLAAALRSLDARVFTDAIPEGLPFDCSATTLARANLWNLTSEGGRIDLVFRPSGTEGYEDLSRRAVTFAVYGTTIQVASLRDILQSKEATDRPQDRQDAVVIREMLRKRGVE